MATVTDSFIKVAEPTSVDKRLRTLRQSLDSGVLDSEFTTEVPWAKRFAWTGSEPKYLGWASPGSTDGEAAWRICKFTYQGSYLVSITWADGNDSFDNVWSNRASLSYV